MRYSTTRSHPVNPPRPSQLLQNYRNPKRHQKRRTRTASMFLFDGIEIVAVVGVLPLARHVVIGGARTLENLFTSMLCRSLHRRLSLLLLTHSIGGHAWIVLADVRYQLLEHDTLRDSLEGTVPERVHSSPVGHFVVSSRCPSPWRAMSVDSAPVEYRISPPMHNCAVYCTPSSERRMGRPPDGLRYLSDEWLTVS